MYNDRASWKVEYLEGLGWSIIDLEMVEITLGSNIPGGDRGEPGLVTCGYATREAAQADIDDPTSLFWKWLRSYLEDDDKWQDDLLYNLFEDNQNITETIRREANIYPKLQAMLDRAWAISRDAQGQFELGLMRSTEQGRARLAEFEREQAARLAQYKREQAALAKHRPVDPDDDDIPF